MKFKTYSALLGALIVAAPFNAAAVSMDNVKTALQPLTDGTDNSEVKDAALRESLGKINTSAAAWACYAINSALHGNALTKGCTSNAGACWLPYLRTMTLNGVTKTAEKLMLIYDADNALVCGIMFTVTDTSCRSKYIEAATAKQYVESPCADVDRGITTTFNIPETYRGPLYTVGKYALKAGKYGLIYQGLTQTNGYYKIAALAAAGLIDLLM